MDWFSKLSDLVSLLALVVPSVCWGCYSFKPYKVLNCLVPLIFVSILVYLQSINLIYLYTIFIAQTAPVVAPGRFRAISISSTSIKFSWNAVNDVEANGVIKWYIVTCYEVENNFVVKKIK